MAAVVGKYAAGKFMSKKQKQDQSSRLEDGRDPYWYLETDKHGRTKKKPKKSPDHYPSYIPLEDRERLNKFRNYAKLMDTALFGQVGASFFVGLIPVAGDFADGGISFLLVQRYANTISCGLPKKVYAEMMGNIGVDVAVGMIPIIGDIADAVYKANIKNLVLLEDYLKKFFAPRADQPMRQVDPTRQAYPTGQVDPARQAYSTGQVDPARQTYPTGQADPMRQHDTSFDNPHVAAKPSGGFFSTFGAKLDKGLEQVRTPAQPVRTERSTYPERTTQPERYDRRGDAYQETGTVYEGRR